MSRVTAVVCAAFDAATDEAIYAVRERVREAGIVLPPRPPHRPHFSLTGARVERDELDHVLHVAAQIAAEHEPVPIVLTEVGRFGRAGALWLGPAPTPGLTMLQRDVYRGLKRAGWAPAFGERSAPNLWVPHCTLATRVPKPQLREVQRVVLEQYQPIRATVAGLATILVGGRGDVGHARLGTAEGIVVTSPPESGDKSPRSVQTVPMLDHVSIQCADIAASARFYDTVLAPLGGKRLMDFGQVLGYGRDFPSFWIGAQQNGDGFRESHLAFRADDRAQVQAFFDAAVAAGAEVLHEPRTWPEYHRGYFGAFVRDPDGNNVEAVCHNPE